MASRSPLVLYMEAQPDGWQTVRNAIREGLTSEKDRLFLLSMSHPFVQICNSKQLREELQSKLCYGKLALEPLHAALQKRDPAAGGQVFLIEGKDNSGFHLQAATIQIAANDGKNSEIYTKQQWEAKQQQEHQGK